MALSRGFLTCGVGLTCLLLAFDVVSAQAPNRHLAEGQGHLDNDEVEAAIASFVRAAELGSFDAEFVLESIYYVGTRVIQDHTQALRWFLKAAPHGHAKSQDRALAG